MIKILGIGSPFGDDQVGWKIAEELMYGDVLPCFIPQYVQIEIHDRPGVRLLDIMNGAETVFIIDAVVSGNTIGQLYRLQDDEIQTLSQILSTHDIGIAETLRLGRSLNQLPNTIIFYGVEIDINNRVNGFSKSIDAAIQQIKNSIETEIVASFANFVARSQPGVHPG